MDIAFYFTNKESELIERNKFKVAPYIIESFERSKLHYESKLFLLKKFISYFTVTDLETLLKNVSSHINST